MEQETTPANRYEPDYSNWKRRTAVFLISQNISLFGSAIVNFAIVWYVTLTTSSGTMMTVTILTTFLPQIAISLFAGVWADRYNRKHVIILSDALTALTTLALALLFLSGHRDLYFIFAASALRSVGSGIQSPAVSAVLPQFVPPEKLMRINGISGSLRSFILLLSPAAGGWLFAAYSVETAFFVDVVTAAAAIVVLSFFRLPFRAAELSRPYSGVRNDLKQGISFVRGNRMLRSLLLYYAFFFFLISPAAFLTPLLTARSYGPEVWRLTANEILYSGGSVFGGFLMALWGGFRNRMHTIALAFAAYGVSSVLLGMSTNFIFYLAVMFFCGIFSPVFYAAETVLIQETVQPDMLGRVFSLIEIIILAVMPVGMLVFGPAADLVRVESILFGTGICMALLGCFIFMRKSHRSRTHGVSC